jgi:regulator of sirC expression with transglutaminase-like and TPR domain
MSQEIEAELALVGRAAEGAIDIARTALALAALDRPGVERKPYLDHLDGLAADVALQKPDGLVDAAAALSRTIAEAHGYAGDQQSYDDMQNANLMRVIDRRKGLPVALGILYMHAGRAQGWRIDGLNFPGHFVLRLELPPGRAILDPFRGGRVVQPDELRVLAQQAAGAKALDPAFTQPVSDRDVLLRLLNNIKSRALRQNDPNRAAEILHRMTLIAPRRGALWGELGLVEQARGNLGHAIQALGRWRDLAASDQERQRAAAALQQTRARLN